jgi:hypothetical protein
MQTPDERLGKVGYAGKQAANQTLHQALDDMPDSRPDGTLIDLQSRFADALRDAKCIDGITPSIEARNDTVTRITDRVGLYRGNQRAHWQAALANAYPVLCSLVGDAYFASLSRAYGFAHPSQSGDLNAFGHALSDFIATYETDPYFAYFSDMAKLEWALHRAHYAADVVALGPQDWAALGADTWLESRIAIHPACSAIASEYAVTDIWFAHQPGGAFPTDIQARSQALVVRPEWNPTVVSHSAADHQTFVSLAQGHTLSDAIGAGLEVDEHFDFAASWAMWVEMKAVIGIRR